MSQRDNRSWKEFELIVTDPPSNSEHFELIKNHLIPFIEELDIHFWVTNYRDSSRDTIRFRVKVNENELGLTEQFLERLVNHNEIVRWEPPRGEPPRDWNPREDARTRIISASQAFGLPPEIAFQTRGPYVISQKIGLEERVEQLESIFTKAVGSCTKALYNTFESKPTDPWMISLLTHLILNSIDISGPNPPCEESSIRYMPVY